MRALLWRTGALPELVQSNGKQDQACDCVDAPHIRVRSGLLGPRRRVSLALGCVTGFHSENRRFEAPVAVREKEGERLRGLTARTPTEGGVGRHTSRRRESDRPEGGSGPPRGQTTDRRGGPHELGGVGTK